MIDDLFGFLRANPDQETIFHAGMSNRGRIETAAVLKAYKFSEPQMVVDVGGGNGGFLSAILACNDQLSGVLFDQARPLKRQRRLAVVLCPAANWCQETSLTTYRRVATFIF